jgi:hypothetical protein
MTDQMNVKELLTSIDEVEKEVEKEEEKQEDENVSMLIEKFVEETEQIKKQWLDLIEKISKICVNALPESKGVQREEEYYTFEELANGADGNSQYAEGRISIAKPVVVEIASFLEKLNDNNQFMDRVKVELGL